MYTVFGLKGAGSVAVQVLLEEAGAPYRTVWVEDVRAADFLRLNPNGKVPALQLPDGQVVYESAAMLIFLAETLPAARMAPAAGSAERALMLQWMVLLSAGVYETVLRYFYSERYGEAASVKAKATEELDRLYGVLEAELVRQGPWLCGTQISVADVCLTMLADWYEPDVDALGARFPRLRALHDAVAARSSWQAVRLANEP
jgi:glutathione S-transferase